MSYRITDWWVDEKERELDIYRERVRDSLRKHRATPSRVRYSESFRKNIIIENIKSDKSRCRAIEVRRRIIKITLSNMTSRPSEPICGSELDANQHLRGILTTQKWLLITFCST